MAISNQPLKPFQSIEFKINKQTATFVYNNVVFDNEHKKEFDLQSASAPSMSNIPEYSEFIICLKGDVCMSGVMVNALTSHAEVGALSSSGGYQSLGYNTGCHAPSGVGEGKAGTVLTMSLTCVPTGLGKLGH